MEIKKVKQPGYTAIKFVAQEGEQQAGWAYLYLIHTDAQDKPYGLLEDVYVQEDYRGQKLGTQLVEAVIAEAKNLGCRKLIGTSRYSRPHVHEWYEKLGFKDWGKEFRMDF